MQNNHVALQPRYRLLCSMHCHGNCSVVMWACEEEGWASSQQGRLFQTTFFGEISLRLSFNKVQNSCVLSVAAGVPNGGPNGLLG